MSNFELNEKGINDFIKNVEEEIIPQKAIEEVQKIKCPICGGTATVKSYNKNKLDLDCCHDELKDKIEQFRGHDT